MRHRSMPFKLFKFTELYSNLSRLLGDEHELAEYVSLYKLEDYYCKYRGDKEGSAFPCGTLGWMAAFLLLDLQYIPDEPPQKFQKKKSKK